MALRGFDATGRGMGQLLDSSYAPSTSAGCRARCVVRSVSRKQNIISCTLVGPDPSKLARTTTAADLVGSPQLKGREVEEAAMWRCIETQQRFPQGRVPSNPRGMDRWKGALLDDAYQRCGEVTAEYAKTFYLGTQLMTPQQARAIWAIYVWCRRTDELVDGPNASRITPKALDRWEERLESVFDGVPYDVLDAALTDTITQFPVDIQPFRDMVDGMRMDLVKRRYQDYDELYEYCYRVAGTVALMSMPVMGVDPVYKGPLERVYRAALALGTANQLTNILRDVGEDIITRNRIYLPLDELKEYGIAESELVAWSQNPPAVMDPRWVKFMQFQIARARDLFTEAEAGVDLLEAKARWPVWSALILYRQILDAIEANGYNNFSRRAYVPKWKKMASLPNALVKALFPQLNPAYADALSS